MNIGDLFFAGHLDNAPLKVDAKKAGEAAGQSFGQQMTASAKTTLGKGLGPGAFVGAAVGAVAAFASVSALTSVLGDATAAALKDEESIARLGASLKANIPAWDGNTAAIEKTLKARMALGFTDEDQRDSLARTVAATHDVNEALAVQATAMDLARFKGISLMEATDALTKVEAGSFRGLKSLGIELRNGATQTEALAAVQKVAGGQAAAYAETNQGKLLVSQVKLGEAMEHLGTAILPAFVSITLAAADAATTFADAVSEAARIVAGLPKEIGGGENALANLARGLDITAFAVTHGGTSFGYYAQKQMEAAAAAREAAAAVRDQADELDRSERSINQNVRQTGSTFDETGAKAADMAAAIKAAGVTSAVAIENMRNRIVAAATGVIDGAYNTISAADNLSGVNAEIAAQRRIIAAGGAAAATDRSTSAIDRQVKALDRASEAERKHTDAQLAAIDVQISQLDLAERQLAIEEQRHSLNEQLNAAERELLVAQGAGDAQGVSDALAKIADLKAQQVENERKLNVEATRNALEAQKAEIEGKARARQTELSDLKNKLHEQEQAVSTSTGATVADARVKLHELYKTQADLVLTLALAGKGGSKAVADALEDMHKRLAKAVGEERLAILATIKALKDLQAQANRTLFTVPGVGSFPRPVGAAGGPTVSDAGPSGKLGAGQQVIVRLEIGGKPLLDYIDAHLNWRRNT